MLVASGQADEVFEVSGVWCQKRRISFGKYGLFVMGIAEDQFHEELAQALQDAGKGEECVFVQVETLDYIGSGEVLQV
ncbi:MAG: hypothetical protein H6767_05665 [Candidatus Peribacteria bacterium]|nr:MAG: hypothetical protein H6767_05665 [Candidatus Peribacteria bacterium]